jgi:hypothetical protein
MTAQSGLQIPNPADFTKFHQNSTEITEFVNRAEEPGKEMAGTLSVIKLLLLEQQI